MEEKDWNDDSLTMTIVSHHCFDNDSEAPSFSISIIERSSCLVCLAAQSSIFRSQRAGTSLLGLVAAKLGACVTLTDDFTRLGISNKLLSITKHVDQLLHDCSDLINHL
ncbi:hypothetical protein GmHk_01G001839 [Glycine max]|nr:hypothetical protein GmHk_01G001839 [Glycine max]